MQNYIISYLVSSENYAHLWYGIDEDVAESMASMIKINTALSKQFAFVGNQAVKQVSSK